MFNCFKIPGTIQAANISLVEAFKTWTLCFLNEDEPFFFRLSLIFYFIFIIIYVMKEASSFIFFFN
jgi:hypothetical protein